MPGKKKVLISIGSLVAISLATVYAFTFSHPASSPPTPQPRAIVASNGKISRFFVASGDLVSKGQPIAQLDASEYEAELKKDEAELLRIQTKAQDAIQPLSAFGGISGILPKQMPVTEVVHVPAKPAKIHQLEIKKPAGPVDDRFAKAADKQKTAADSLSKATQDLAKATAQLIDAQKARDALRIKETQAVAAASDAARKAAGAPDLLTAGVISRNRAQQLSDDSDAAKKTVEAVQAEVKASDEALSGAQAAQQEAQAELDKSQKEIALADADLTKANVEPKIAPPAPKAPVAAKPQAMETRIVTRHMSLVRREEPPAIPVQVIVDEKVMNGAQDQIPVLQKRILELKALIAACQVLAPVSGRVEISGSGAIAIYA